MIDIMISYRTADEPLAAVLIDEALTKRIGPRVFRDHRSIAPGAAYPAEIWTAVGQCQILAAVIGTRWLERDEHGRRRIDDPKDYVRREVAEALRRRVVVVPILVGDAELPAAGDLPLELRGLALCQYRTLRFRDAAQDADRLADELVGLLAAPATEPAPASPTTSDPATVAGTPSVVTTFSGPVDIQRGIFGIVNHYQE
nr:hypothetical protein GCM10020063_084720 [Dactylosporangium thailandense]